ncbi:MAG TPA: roadblock/LC7 domain-containing protein [Candidatus Limnocylindria bacterium]|nr:roadblock/LC7 domain-containing protein [Candidatus Limnocylindria bacterium]
MTPSRLVQSPAPRLTLSLESETGARGRHVCDVVERLVDLHLVRGAMIVAPDGFVIAAQIPPALAVEPLAALAATLGRELEINAARLGGTPFQTALFSADDGALCLGTTRIGFVVVLAEPHANLHTIRAAVRDAVARIEAVWQEAAPPPA